jgi:hypothetical protein
MAEHSLTELFSDIADAIRAKTGGTADLVADTFPTAIASIPSGGGNYQSKTVSPTTSEQTITPDTGYDGLSAVTVNPAPLEAKTITPSAQEQVVTPTAPNIGLSSVTVNGDVDLIATNIKRDVSIFGVVGTFEGGDDVVTQLCNQDNTKDITFPAVTTLRKALYGLGTSSSWFTRKIVIPSGVATIAASFVYDVFRYANGELRIPATVSSIGSSAFYNYGIGGSGISLYIEGGSVGLEIARYGFEKVKLVSAYLPARITAIGHTSFQYMFNNCTALESVTVEDGWDTYLDLTWSPITLESITSIITAWASNPTKSLALSTASYALYEADATAVAAAAAKGLTVTAIAR